MEQKEKYPKRIEGILVPNEKIGMHHMTGKTEEVASKLMDFLHNGTPKDLKTEELVHANIGNQNEFARSLANHKGFSILLKDRRNISAIKLPRTKT